MEPTTTPPNHLTTPTPTSNNLPRNIPELQLQRSVPPKHLHQSHQTALPNIHRIHNPRIPSKRTRPHLNHLTPRPRSRALPRFRRHRNPNPTQHLPHITTRQRNRFITPTQKTTRKRSNLRSPQHQPKRSLIIRQTSHNIPREQRLATPTTSRRHHHLKNRSPRAARSIQTQQIIASPTLPTHTRVQHIPIPTANTVTRHSYHTPHCPHIPTPRHTQTPSPPRTHRPPHTQQTQHLPHKTHNTRHIHQPTHSPPQHPPP